ncbi:manganese efflux pump MntP family protein [Oceanobacillus jeddahense]|uniref:manganese efflux pump MntP n=1 Tax=Oceanobacillus jeddahense TaxID=1462527 RepID=UPI000595D8C4|nr:manganese efflux pump MntP family protein [Oceanobacillus jeddahense]
MFFSTELISLALLAVGLSMDAFSISLGLGMNRMRLKRIAMIGLVIGGFHMLFPMAGMLLGHALSEQVGQWTALASGILLFFIGAHMFFSAFRIPDEYRWQPVGLGLWMLAFSVSLDSFTVGFSLGISGVTIIFTLVIFGIVSCIFTWIGLLLGRRLQGFFGTYSELFGGIILSCFGIYLIFS